MIRAVVLDSGPLGQITNPKPTSHNDACKEWVKGLQVQRIQIIIPEIVDYEIRRELLRANKTAGITLLDAACEKFNYLPIRTSAMRLAAQKWAEARQQGKPTVPDLALDADMILVGQVLALDMIEGEIVVATSNVAHIARFVPAKSWNEITIGTVGE
jgi:predicted nucleic acid-binding protein